MYTIYKITNKVNGKVYIGQTGRPIIERWKEHIKTAETKKSKFYNAIRKHGVENFEIVGMIEVSCSKDANMVEAYYIWLYDSVKSGYNIKWTESKETFCPENYYEYKLEWKREYNKKSAVEKKRKEYFKRTDVLDRQKKYSSEWRKKPEVKKYKNEYQKEWRNRKDVKEVQLKYHREYEKKRKQKPEVKEYIREYQRQYRLRKKQEKLNKLLDKTE